MIYKQIPTSGFASNCWLLIDEATRFAAIIDPSASCNTIQEVLEREQCVLQMILLTHRHFDHIFSLDELRDIYNVPAIIHEADAGAISDAVQNASSLLVGEAMVYRQPERSVRAGEIVMLGDTQIHVVHTPGHTPGSVCYRVGCVLFTGDTLFDCSIGRTDLPGGSVADMFKSLTYLSTCPREMTVVPGHGNTTTIGQQCRKNPFFQYFR